MSIENGNNPRPETKEEQPRGFRKVRVYNAIFALNEERSDYLNAGRDQITLEAFSDKLEGLSGDEFKRAIKLRGHNIGAYIGRMAFYLTGWSRITNVPDWVQRNIDDVRSAVKSRDGYPDGISDSDIIKVAKRQISFQELIAEYDRPRT